MAKPEVVCKHCKQVLSFIDAHWVHKLTGLVRSLRDGPHSAKPEGID